MKYLNNFKIFEKNEDFPLYMIYQISEDKWDGGDFEYLVKMSDNEVMIIYSSYSLNYLKNDISLDRLKEEFSMYSFINVGDTPYMDLEEFFIRHIDKYDELVEGLIDNRINNNFYKLVINYIENNKNIQNARNISDFKI